MVSRTQERMSKVDTAWLRMDSPSNLMMIVGVWVIRPGIPYEALALRLRERLLLYPRFTQVVVEDGTGARWVPDAQFDLSRHLVVEHLTKAHGQSEQQALQQRLGALCMEPLDRGRPLWQFHFVPHYRGGCALMVRIHHCIADGIALIAVTQSLVDGGKPPPPPTPRVRHEGLEGAEDWLADTLLKPLTALAVKGWELAGDSAARTTAMMVHPQQGLERNVHESAEAARLAYHAVSDMAALALMPDDSPTGLKGMPGLTKQVAWCAPLPLSEVKAVGKAFGCSINDVLLSCVAGAIQAYLLQRGEEVGGKEIRAMVPVNLRPLDKAYELGNKFGLAPLVLPIGLDNPVERLLEVRRRMQELKHSMQPLMAFGLLALAGVLNKGAQDAMLHLFSKKTTAVMTNVPGPRDKLSLCGATIEESLFWVPQSGTVGLGVSILSYGGGVQFGVVADATLCPDPQRIIDRFAPQFDTLTWLALMLPWGAIDD